MRGHYICNRDRDRETYFRHSTDAAARRARAFRAQPVARNSRGRQGNTIRIPQKFQNRGMHMLQRCVCVCVCSHLKKRVRSKIQERKRSIRWLSPCCNSGSAMRMFIAKVNLCECTYLSLCLVIKSAVWLTFARHCPLVLCGILPLRADENGIAGAEQQQRRKKNSTRNNVGRYDEYHLFQRYMTLVISQA